MPILIEGGPSPAGWSRYADFFRCERLYALRRNRPRTEVTDGPLARGATGHVGLAHVYKRVQQEQRGLDPDEYYTPEEAMRQYVQQHGVYRTAWEPAVHAVRAHAPTPHDGKVLHVEEVFSAHGAYGEGKRAPLTMRPDVVIERAGKVWIVDHKIVYKHDVALTQRYNLSGQFLIGQTLGAKLWPGRFGGVLINALSALSPYRCTLYPLEAAPGALASFLPALKEGLRRIDECERRGHWQPAFHEQVCVSAYGVCEEYDACIWERMA